MTIAQALACRPELIVADEPFTALDGPRVVSLARLFRRLCQDLRSSFLLISHTRGFWRWRQTPPCTCVPTDRLMSAGRLLEVRGLSKIYPQGIAALRDVSVTLDRAVYARGSRALLGQGRARWPAAWAHLASGCVDCRDLFGFTARLAATCANLRTIEVPESTTRVARAIFPTSAQYGRDRRMPIELIFDSFLAPSPAGLRATWQVRWQGLYRAGECSVDLRIEPELTSPRRDDRSDYESCVSRRGDEQPDREPPVKQTGHRGNAKLTGSESFNSNMSGTLSSNCGSN